MSDSFALLLTSKTTNFETLLSTPIYLDENKKYKAALIKLETYNSLTNITSKNNVFKYSSDRGVSWKQLILPKDAYEYIHIAWAQ